MPLAIVILALLLFAALRRVDVFDAFKTGAGDALRLIVRLIPTMAAFMAALKLLTRSGAEAWLLETLSPVLSRVGADARLLPLLLARPLSGSAAMGALSDLFTRYGPDTPLTLTAGVLLGSSETVFYTLALYFGAVKIRRSRFAVPVALAALFTSVAAGLWFSSIFFGSR